MRGMDYWVQVRDTKKMVEKMCEEIFTTRKIKGMVFPYRRTGNGPRTVLLVVV